MGSVCSVAPLAFNMNVPFTAPVTLTTCGATVRKTPSRGTSEEPAATHRGSPSPSRPHLHVGPEAAGDERHHLPLHRGSVPQVTIGAVGGPRRVRDAHSGGGEVIAAALQVPHTEEVLLARGEQARGGDLAAYTGVLTWRFHKVCGTARGGEG